QTAEPFPTAGNGLTPATVARTMNPARECEVRPQSKPCHAQAKRVGCVPCFRGRPLQHVHLWTAWAAKACHPVRRFCICVFLFGRLLLRAPQGEPSCVVISFSCWARHWSPLV